MSRTRAAVGGAILAAVAIFAGQFLGSRDVRRLQNRVDELQAERARLNQYVDRLAASRRVAQVDVLDQRTEETGRVVTGLRWQEIADDGALGIPQTLEVLGKSVYFEALVIKFRHQHVGRADKDRDRSLALFRRIFGDQQTPESGFPLPEPAAAPTTSPAAPNEILWERFWELVDDPRLAERYGVRAAQCEAPAVPVRAGQTWEVTLDAAGGLNLRKLEERPTTRAPSRAASTNASSS